MSLLGRVVVVGGGASGGGWLVSLLIEIGLEQPATANAAAIMIVTRIAPTAPQPSRRRRNRRDAGSAAMKQSLPVKTFEELFAELGERARTRPAGSATVAALDAGVHTLGKKILEEAGEVWLAAEHEPDEALAEEISQLLYWTQVLMVARGLTLDDVYRKL